MTKDFTEGIVHDHRVPNYVNASFTTGKLLCITFERKATTLHELLDGSRTKHNWLVKCHLIVRDLIVTIVEKRFCHCEFTNDVDVDVELCFMINYLFGLFGLSKPFFR